MYATNTDYLTSDMLHLAGSQNLTGKHADDVDDIMLLNLKQAGRVPLHYVSSGFGSHHRKRKKNFKY